MRFGGESGYYPLPNVVRTDALAGHTPILREWWTRAHLSAMSAPSPGGTCYVHAYNRPIRSIDIVDVLEHLLREVAGRMVMIWGGSPIHRRQMLQAFLANGASGRLPRARLPA